MISGVHAEADLALPHPQVLRMTRTIRFHRGRQMIGEDGPKVADSSQLAVLEQE